MHRIVWMIALAILAHFTNARTVEAQSRGGLNSGWGGVDLLLHPLVQKELKLDAEQIRKARDLSLALLDRQKVIFAKLEGLSGEARTQKAHELAAEHADDGFKSVAAILDPAQVARFRQIDLQQRGANALVEPALATSLKISPEQIAQIRPILDHSVVLMREALSNTRGDRRASTEKIQAIRAKTNSQALACLNEAQKEAWITMIGPSLELSPVGRSAR